ncbi:MAG: HD family phosphohydrolase [Sphaerochaeta sp.]
MKKTKTDRTESNKATYFICLAIMLVCSVLVPVLLKTAGELHYRSVYSGYTAGEISDRNVYAKTSIDLIDNEATAANMEEARRSTLPVFSYSITKSSAIIEKTDMVRTAIAKGDKDALEKILGASMALKLISNENSDIMSLVYDIVREIIITGYFDASEISAARAEGYSQITLSNRYGYETNNYESTVSIDDTNIITSSTIRQYLSEKLKTGFEGLSAADGILLEELIAGITEPNIVYDSVLTQYRRDEAAKSVDPVVISITKGQILIAADHVVNHEQIELLKLLSTQSNRFTFLETFGHIVFDAVMLAVGLVIFGSYIGKNDFHFVQYHILLTVAFIISLIAAYFLTLISSRLNLEFTDSFLPVFLIPLFMTDVTGARRVGFISSFMFSAVMATLPTSSVYTFFYCLVCGSTCVLLIRFFNKRLDMVYQWFFSSIACAGVTIIFMLINEVSFRMIFTVLLGTLMNVAIAYILLSALLPLAEKVFNLPTVFRLYELAYGDSPLLTRLSQSAPGTYSHSVAVADLAEVGARAIGANALLARVGGLYHDIGKIEHPEYFIENQNGVNKHDDINPSLSVAIIKSHIKIGADKGREAGLPIEIVKIIESHHGNDVISYFYNEALKTHAAMNSDDRGDSVKASDFAYNAEIPDFRECGIVSLADAVEAASRTVTPNASKYAKLIDSIFLGKIERGQLDNSCLTMNDIKTLSEAFVKTLVARNHSRIEYPDED